MSVAYVPELGQVAGAAFAKGIAHAEMNKNVSKTRTRTICGSPFWVLLKVHRPLLLPRQTRASFDDILYKLGWGH